MKKLSRCDKLKIILDFNPEQCQKHLKTKKHCKLYCDGVYEKYDFISDKSLTSQVKKFVDEELASQHVNLTELLDKNITDYDFWVNDKAERGEIILRADNKYTADYVSKFISTQEKYLARCITLILTSHKYIVDDEEKVKIIRSIAFKLTRILREIERALKRKENEYAMVLMFCAGRMFERTIIIALKESIMRGIKNPKTAPKGTAARVDYRKNMANKDKYQEEIDKYFLRNPANSFSQALDSVGIKFETSGRTIRRNVKNPKRK